MRSARTHLAWNDERAVHFVSTPTAGRRRIFHDDRCCEIIREQMSFYADRYRVDLLAYVIMPDHLHLLIWPQGDRSFMDYMRGVKSYSGKQILRYLDAAGSGDPVYNGTERHDNSTRNSRGPQTPAGRRVWQPEFFDYLIFSREKLREKLEYIVRNPVEESLVSEPHDYKWLFVDQEKVNELLSW